MLIAFFQGILGASSLAIGAGLGLLWQPGRTLSAAIMAFGSGTLLSALAFEITITVHEQAGFLPLMVGFLFGGSLFTIVTHYVDAQGGFVRHAASQRRYLYEHRQDEVLEVLDQLAHIRLIQELPPAEVQAIVPFLHLVSVPAGNVICQEGEPGDSMYLIIEGQAEICKGSHQVAILNKGEVFGEMSLLIGEPRTATVKALEDMSLYKIMRRDFDVAMSRAPHLANALNRTLARRLRDTTQLQAEATRDLQQWRRRVLDSVELDLNPAEEQELVRDLVSSAAPLAILVGTLLDNIPESAVIGMGSHQAQIGGSFLLAVFISNFPEALSSSIGMRQAGTQPRRILLLWLGVVVLSGICAAIGSVIGMTMPLFVVAIAQAFAGGAILAMLASTMMPEAYELGGSVVVFATISGFLSGFLISSLHGV